MLMWDAFQGLRGAWQLAIRLACEQRLRLAPTTPPATTGTPRPGGASQSEQGRGQPWAERVLRFQGALSQGLRTAQQRGRCVESKPAG